MDTKPYDHSVEHGSDEDYEVNWKHLGYNEDGFRNWSKVLVTKSDISKFRSKGILEEQPRWVVDKNLYPESGDIIEFAPLALGVYGKPLEWTESGTLAPNEDQNRLYEDEHAVLDEMRRREVRSDSYIPVLAEHESYSDRGFILLKSDFAECWWNVTNDADKAVLWTLSGFAPEEADYMMEARFRSPKSAQSYLASWREYNLFERYCEEDRDETSSRVIMPKGLDAGDALILAKFVSEALYRGWDTKTIKIALKGIGSRANGWESDPNTEGTYFTSYREYLHTNLAIALGIMDIAKGRDLVTESGREIALFLQSCTDAQNVPNDYDDIRSLFLLSCFSTPEQAQTAGKIMLGWSDSGDTRRIAGLVISGVPPEWFDSTFDDDAISDAIEENCNGLLPDLDALIRDHIVNIKSISGSDADTETASEAFKETTSATTRELCWGRNADPS